MGIEELCALPVADLAAPDSVLFLWATFPQLPETLRLIKAWGFQYKSVGFGSVFSYLPLTRAYKNTTI